MSNLAHRQHNAILAPSLTTRAMADLTGKYMNRLEDKPGDFRRKIISAPLAPAGDERRALEDRRDELKLSLVATPDQDARDQIDLLLAGAPAFGMSEREAGAKLILYAEALCGEPTWAIQRARQLFAKGGWKSGWNGTGCPSSANVVAECRQITLPIEAEIYRIEQILNAETVDNETTDLERQEALDAWTKLKADMGRSNVITERTTDAIEAERAAFRKVNERFDAERAASETARKAKVGADSHG